MAPRGRFELPTFRLTAERSTIELPGNVFILRKFMGRFKLARGVGSVVWQFINARVELEASVHTSHAANGLELV
jgi:hypothetical protein